ncbi:hypothetical protein [Rathayibacter festucae]|uniref:hypothetical protein n=1 Tax=Rathayibacter festucae TaxID=110937 RepID=UPI000FDCC795|nr:hypothetical protein [Rathayibacter festucae]
MMKANFERPSTRILVWAQKDLGSKLMGIDQELVHMSTLGKRPGFEVKICLNMVWEDLSAVISEFEPNVFHFIGHGEAGSLVAYRLEDGIPAEARISPFRLTQSLLFPHSSICGIFLNGCETSNWAPHLIPRNGWFIGANREVHDDSAVLFAEFFYEEIALGRKTDVAYTKAINRVSALPGHSGLAAVHWKWDTEPAVFLWHIFDRAAFRDPVRLEGPLREVQIALSDVRSSLRDGRLYTRHDLGHPGVIRCTGALDKSHVKRILVLLSVVNHDLKTILTAFPLLLDEGYNSRSVPMNSEPQFQELADLLDASRNTVIEEVNSHLDFHLWLDPVK